MPASQPPALRGATWNEFISLDFTHHMEILSKTKDISERFFISMNVQIRNNLKKISILTYFAIYLSYLHNALPARATIPYIFRI